MKTKKQKIIISMPMPIAKSLLGAVLAVLEGLFVCVCLLFVCEAKTQINKQPTKQTNKNRLDAKRWARL